MTKATDRVKSVQNDLAGRGRSPRYPSGTNDTYITSKVKSAPFVRGEQIPRPRRSRSSPSAVVVYLMGIVSRPEGRRRRGTDRPRRPSGRCKSGQGLFEYFN